MPGERMPWINRCFGNVFCECPKREASNVASLKTLNSTPMNTLTEKPATGTSASHLSQSGRPAKFVQPYLFFDGRCDEALEFYHQNVGAEVTLRLRFKDSPDPTMCPAGDLDKVMHASFRIGATELMASDGRCQNKTHFEGFGLSLTVPTEADADRVFGALSVGGQVQMPLAKTFFSPRFGMVADRFGVCWMVMVTPTTA
jgi:PhnB protein